jgi:hypothetical protein
MISCHTSNDGAKESSIIRTDIIEKYSLYLHGKQLGSAC